MLRFAKRVVRRLLGAGGYAVVGANQFAQLQQNLIETKAGVSALQGQVGEIHSHVPVLRQELAQLQQGLNEIKAGVSAAQERIGEIHSQVSVLRQEPAVPVAAVPQAEQLGTDNKESPQAALDRLGRELSEERRNSRFHAAVRGLPQRLDAAAMRCLAANEGGIGDVAESEGLANYYSRSADLVSRHWVRPGLLPPDPYTEDDLTLDFAVRTGVFVPGLGNEAEVDPTQRSFPWRHLLADPDCGVFLVLGQSNAANHGDTRYAAKRDVFNLDFLRMHCTRAHDPLAGASGAGGSVWSRLGDLLIENGAYRRVLFVPLAFGGAFISDFTPGGSKHGRTALALSRLLKELGTLPLQFSAVLWQQGEAEANHTRMTATAYQAHFYDIVSDLRARGVFAPVFIANATLCEAGPHPYQNHEAIRQGQRAVVNPAGGILPGPDVDTIEAEGRSDGCHLSDVGLRRCAELWLESLAPRRHLLERP